LLRTPDFPCEKNEDETVFLHAYISDEAVGEAELALTFQDMREQAEEILDFLQSHSVHNSLYQFDSE
jgi:hypothetical protein